MATSRRSGLLALLLLLAALLAGAVWMVLGSGDGNAPEGTSGPPAAESEAGPGRAAEHGPRPRERVGEEPADERPTAGQPRSTEPEPTTPTHAPAPPTRTVHVLVVHEGGVPVRDARVTAFSLFGNVRATPEDAVTDVEGRATIAVSGMTNFQVRAWTRDAAALGERVSVTPDATLDVTLTLLPGRPVAGRVESESFTPIPGARVQLSLPSDDPFGLRVVAESDERGRFDLGVLPADLLDGAATRVLTAARGHVRLDVPLAELGDASLLVLRLARGQTVRGRCVATGAAPVSGVRVTMGGVEGVVTGPDGTFELEGVGSDGGALEILPPEHVVPPPLEVAPGTGDVDLGDVLLVAGQPISGVVVDEQDRPVAWATVHAWEQERQREVRQANTDHAGRFTLAHIGEGAHTILAQPTQGGEWSSRVSGRVTDVTAGTTGLRVVLTGGLTLLVTFRSAADQTPVQVASAEVEVTRTDVEAGRTVSAWAGPGMTTVRVTFDVAGRYRVVVKVPGYEPATLEDVEIVDDRATQIDALFRRVPE